ncbi:MAG: GAF domain-containing sensor histidine kinase [Acidobacteria bacterium]|nr:GAF domain-containing sensor histidine kinase [Acidobacteriota bacterium]
MDQSTTTETGSRPDAPAEPGAEQLWNRFRTRLRHDVRQAMVDPSARPTGDFELDEVVARDRIAAFTPLITAARLATTIISVLLVSTSADAETRTLQLWTAVLVANAVFRSFRPLRYADGIRSLAVVLAEVAVTIVAVVATGGWRSPLILMLLTAVMIAGLARGFGFSIRVAVATIVAVTVPSMARSADPRDVILEALSWGAIVVLVAITAGYARRISGEADRDRELALGRLHRLSDANDLLYSLHQVTQTLPASLDLGEVLDSTMARMKSLVACDSIAVLLFDDTDAHWDVARHHGLHLPSRLGPTELPDGLRRAIAANGTSSSEDLSREPGGGLSGRAGSGVYAVLSARGSIIGLLAVEHSAPGQFTERDIEVVSGFVEPAALAIDNARWFTRLRTVGADEERTRIARDLHDRIGQSIAYLAFELDRLVERDESGESISRELGQLREDVRGVIREVRDTLYDLRTDVSDVSGVADVLEEYAARVGERSGIQVHVDADRSHRLPILQERELWRVAQEALANVERHAHATAVRILWRCDGERAVIDVTDNGIGFAQDRAGRLDSYGVLGMRERAASIGASLEIHSAPGRGTRVRCILDPTSAESSADARTTRPPAGIPQVATHH